MHVHGGEGHVPQAVCGGQRTTSPMESVTFLHLYFGSGNELRSSGCCKQVLYPPGQLAALLDPFSKPVKIEIRTFLSWALLPFSAPFPPLTSVRPSLPSDWSPMNPPLPQCFQPPNPDMHHPGWEVTLGTFRMFSKILLLEGRLYSYGKTSSKSNRSCPGRSNWTHSSAIRAMFCRSPSRVDLGTLMTRTVAYTLLHSLCCVDTRNSWNTRISEWWLANL